MWAVTKATVRNVHPKMNCHQHCPFCPFHSKRRINNGITIKMAAATTLSSHKVTPSPTHTHKSTATIVSFYSQNNDSFITSNVFHSTETNCRFLCYAIGGGVRCDMWIVSNKMFNVHIKIKTLHGQLRHTKDPKAMSCQCVRTVCDMEKMLPKRWIYAIERELSWGKPVDKRWQNAQKDATKIALQFVKVELFRRTTKQRWANIFGSNKVIWLCWCVLEPLYATDTVNRSRENRQVLLKSTTSL